MAPGQGSIVGNGDVARAWARVRANLRLSAGARLFDQWLAPIQLVESEDGADVRLTLPSAFMTTWVRSHYADRLVHEFRAILPGIRSVEIETAPRAASVEVVAADPAPAPASAAAAAEPTPANERPSRDPRQRTASPPSQVRRA